MNRKRYGDPWDFRYKLSQISRVMKMVFFMMLLSLTHLSASVKSQNSVVNLTLKNVSVEQALTKVEKQLKQNFFFNRENVDLERKVDLQLSDADLDELVLQLFGRDYKYRVVDNIIVVSRKDEEQEQPQQIKVEGVVKDKRGDALPGVTVLIKGTKIGVATDLDGKYSLSVPVGAQVLVFSMVGMQDKEETVGKRTRIDVVLEEAVSELEDVVVTGYYTQAKNSFTGAARTITAEELQMGGNQNILTALQNVDPSFMKIDNNLAGSNPNVVPEFQIRGAGSISGIESEYEGNPNSPVFIVDGFEMTAEKVYDMDPYRVASITLLKDASATAMYGTRGANGVVVITTKRPEPGRLQLTYRGGVNIEAPDFTSYNLLDAREKLEYEKLAGVYSIGNVEFDQKMKDLYNKRMLDVARGVNTYWLKYPVRTGVGHRHSLRLEGGDEAFRYAAGLSYNHVAGTMKGSDRTTINGNVFLSYNYKNLTSERFAGFQQ